MILVQNSTVFGRNISTVIVGLQNKERDNVHLVICPNGKVLFFVNNSAKYTNSQSIMIFYPSVSRIVSYQPVKNSSFGNYKFKILNEKTIVQTKDGFLLDSSFFLGENSCSIINNHTELQILNYSLGDFNIKINFIKNAVDSITISNRKDVVNSTINILCN